MTDVKLTDSEWEKIREFLRADPNVYVGKDEQACRRFVEAVKWSSRSGSVVSGHMMASGIPSISALCAGVSVEFGNGC